MSNVINFPVNGKSIRRPQVMLVQDDSFQDNTPGLRSKAAEPIKRIEDIQAISNYLVQEKRYRDNLLFVAGINFGLRCGDLLQLKVGNVITEDGQSYKEEVIIREQKTNKIRRVYLNDAVMDALDLYLSSMTEVSLNDYLFRSNSNRNVLNGTTVSGHGMAFEVRQDHIIIVIGKIRAHIIFSQIAATGDRKRHRAVFIHNIHIGDGSITVIFRHLIVHGSIGPLTAIGCITLHNRGIIERLHQIAN